MKRFEELPPVKPYLWHQSINVNIVINRYVDKKVIQVNIIHVFKIDWKNCDVKIGPVCKILVIQLLETLLNQISCHINTAIFTQVSFYNKTGETVPLKCLIR